MEDCVFCKIAEGELPAEKIYEDNLSVAFLDINPVNPGHTLLIPKAHYPTMVDTPDEVVAHLYKTAKRLMHKIQEAMNADFVVLSVVGVDVAHFHIHLVPRYFDDGLANFWPSKKYEEGEMEEVAERLRHVIGTKNEA
ncbi:HIT domain-containing protein [Candidatus Pacearchaeota archaeon]|nr:MAG: HIT domain-containing protein [Candidatus Pacearchaeota archaeon]